MKACIAGLSALRWWLHNGHLLEKHKKKPLPRSFDPEYTSSDIKRLQLIFSDPQPICLGVPGIKSRRRPNNVSEISLGDSARHSHFFQFDNSIWICEPSLAFFQSLRHLHDISAIQAACRLLSTYRYDGDQVVQAPPLATWDSLEKAKASCKGLFDARRAYRILRYTAENSASPREAQAYLLLCLPRHLGGYGLPKPQLNGAVRLTKASTSGIEFLHGDIVWADQRIILEYESNEFHANEKQLEIDSRRRTLLADEGYSVFTMTNNQLVFEAETERLARVIAKAMGIAIRPDSYFGKSNRRALRTDTLSPNKYFKFL